MNDSRRGWGGCRSRAQANLKNFILPENYHLQIAKSCGAGRSDATPRASALPLKGSTEQRLTEAEGMAEAAPRRRALSTLAGDGLRVKIKQGQEGKLLPGALPPYGPENSRKAEAPVAEGLSHHVRSHSSPSRARRRRSAPRPTPALSFLKLNHNPLPLTPAIPGHRLLTRVAGDGFNLTLLLFVLPDITN